MSSRNAAKMSQEVIKTAYSALGFPYEEREKIAASIPCLDESLASPELVDQAIVDIHNCQHSLSQNFSPSVVDLARAGVFSANLKKCIGRIEERFEPFTDVKLTTAAQLHSLLFDRYRVAYFDAPGCIEILTVGAIFRRLDELKKGFGAKKEVKSPIIADWQREGLASLGHIIVELGQRAKLKRARHETSAGVP